MAVDTAEKRLSILNWDWYETGLPSPDGAFDQGDRQTILNGYSGLLWPEPTEISYEILEFSGTISDSFSGSGAITESITESGTITAISAFGGTRDE